MKHQTTGLKNGAVIFLIAVFFGCATPPQQVPLNKGCIGEIESVDVYIYLIHDKIHAEIEDSNVTSYTGGGLIPALIDAGIESSREDKAEVLLQPIRSAMADYDCGDRLRTQIVGELSSLGWFKIGNVEVMKGTLEKDLKNDVKDSDANAVLAIGTDYYLSSDFKHLYLKGAIQLLPKSHTTEINFKDYLYRNMFSYRDPSDTYSNSPAEAANKWAENNAALTRQAIEDGAKYLAKHIADELKL